ncbi:winged helix-turn-helix transcriptional regulator [Desulfitobacterium metallireducens]|uniref:Transcriptional regulator n=1 Tax=Desulfitobacterium metallireducens DSM 15288 TaxID=871968 RepID=W0E6E8_9FIRM|nr:helix-turn-helix domain-containing protein [Desulfitobacterium metallireducens]AHF06450.1 transcriptional regulator [Desulfitobacterium metallireducens DSM 15288]
MQKNNSFSDCPLEYAISILGGKWKLQIIWTIYTAKSIRFNQLKQELDGITDMMLTKILKEFVTQNIIIRHQYNEIPPHVEYSLSENGLKLVEALSEVRKWSREVQ